MANPFLNAIQKKIKGSPSVMNKNDVLDAMPRVLAIRHADMPSLKKSRPGDKVTAHIRGVIHSMDQHGVQVHVSDVSDPSVNFGDDEKEKDQSGD